MRYLFEGFASPKRPAHSTGRFRNLMSSHLRYLTLRISVVAWSLVLLAATYQSHTPVVFGRYSWGYIALLGLLVGVALTLSLAKSAWYQTLSRPEPVSLSAITIY
jgi:hypothetical protein